jgi:hypothetical protein
VATAIDLVTREASGACGEVRDVAGTPLRQIACGSIKIGDGQPGIYPDAFFGADVIHRFALANCSGTTCSIRGHASGPDGVGCTQTGCAFGVPLPIPSGGQTACAQMTFASPPSGTIDVAAGTTTNLSLQLNTHMWITGTTNVTQPCPRCTTSVPASRDAPQTGTCDRGANAGGACVTTSPGGLSSDCLPGGGDGSIDAGVVATNLAPLVPAPFTVANGTGAFCPGQNAPGCLGQRDCRTIVVNGAPAGSLLPVGTTSPATLATTFCVPASPIALLNFFMRIPGPGVAAISADLRLVP